MKDESLGVFILITIFVLLFLCGLYLLFFTETNDTKCFDYYAEQYCRLNKMKWDGIEIIPFPVSGFHCIKSFTSGDERIGYKESIKRNRFYFSDDEIKECTKEPIINILINKKEKFVKEKEKEK